MLFHHSDLRVCSPVPCDEFALILEENGNATSAGLGLGPQLPVIEMLGPEELRLPYRQPLPFSLLGCPSQDDTSACGAIAVDPASGADLTGAIRCDTACRGLAFRPAFACMRCHEYLIAFPSLSCHSS